MSDDRTYDLIQRHLEQVATAEELAELDRLVSERAEAADALWEAARVDALLTMRLQGTAGWPIRADFPPPRRRRRLALAVLAAAATLLVGATAWWWLRGAGGHPVVAGAIEVGGAPAVRIGNNVPLRVVGDRPAVIKLADGAEAELAVSTAAVIRRPGGSEGQVVELLEGGGRFHVPRADRPFCVQTCSGSVTAVDTDFEVNLWPTQAQGDEEMSFRNLFVLAVAVVAGAVQVDSPGEKCVLSAGSQAVFGAEPSTPAGGKQVGNWLPSGEALGFTAKGKGTALERSLPGIQAALDLNDEQKKGISAAIAETVQSPPVRSAMASIKLDPKATAAQKEAAQEIVDEARAKLKARVGEILTAEQKALVERISAAAAEAQKQASEAMRAELTEAKGDAKKMEQVQQQLRQKTRDVIQSHLEKFLTPAQLASYKKAAEAQIAAEAEARKHPKDK